MMSNVYMFHSMLNHWVYCEEYYSLIVHAVVVIGFGLGFPHVHTSLIMFSMHSGIGPWMGNPISPLMDLSHAACLPILASSMYSVSPTKSAIIFCHCNAQEMHLSAIKTTCPDVE